MPTVTMSLPGGEFPPGFDYNPSLGDLLFLENAELLGTPNVTRISYQLQSGLILKLNGTGFAFDANGLPTAGTLTSAQIFLEDGSSVLQAVTGINLSLIDVFDAAAAFESDSWSLAGWLLNGNDVINGSVSNDDIFGRGGNDTLKGGAGDDYLQGGAGVDTYDGGADFDQLSFYDTYSDPTALHGVVLDAQAGTVVDPWGNNETFKNIESFRGTHFADVLNGSSLDEQFLGMGGRDKIDGKGGIDTVRYDRDFQRGGNRGVEVNLSTGVAFDGYGRQDTLSNWSCPYLTGQSAIEFVLG